MSEGFVTVDSDSQPETTLSPISFAAPPVQRSAWRVWGMVLGAAVVWLLVWGRLQPFADWLTYDLIGLAPRLALRRVGGFLPLRCSENPAAAGRHDLRGDRAARFFGAESTPAIARRETSREWGMSWRRGWGSSRPSAPAPRCPSSSASSRPASRWA